MFKSLKGIETVCEYSKDRDEYDCLTYTSVVLLPVLRDLLLNLHNQNLLLPPVHRMGRYHTGSQWGF